MPVYLKSGGGTPGGSDNQVQFNDNGAFGGVEALGSAAFVLDADGNSRGNYSNDLQRFRSAATMVTSGTGSTISGGYSNTAAGNYAVIGGGSSNNAGSSTGFGVTISGGGYNTANNSGDDFMTISGGFGNTASGKASSIGGGQNNTVSSYYSTVAGGYYNSSGTAGFGFVGGGFFNATTGKYGAVVGGESNSVSGDYSVILNGNTNTASADYATVLNGADVTADKIGQVAWNGGDSSSQTSSFIITASTNSTNTSTLKPGTGNLTVPNNTAWVFMAHIVAKEQGAGNVKQFTRKGTIVNQGGTTTIGTVDAVGTDQTIGSPGDWTIAVTADDTNDFLKIAGTGAGAYTLIKWVGRVDIAAITY